MKQPYKRYGITNGTISITISTLGATITNIKLPYQNQQLDIVLGFDEEQDYLKHTSCYFGGIIGRNANRIANGQFKINHKTYQIAQNEGDNNLHSGPDGYQLRTWEVMHYESDKITLQLISPDQDQGFPGKLEIQVTYEITREHALVITYKGMSEEVTVFNPTNHSYFNLNGHDKGSIMEHQLWLKSHQYSELDNTQIPTGNHKQVQKTNKDFTTLRNINWSSSEYDDNYILDEHTINEKVATLKGDQTQIVMHVYTDMPCIQLYTGNGLKDVPGKGRTNYQKHNGVCLETQYEPNSANTNHQVLINGEKTYQTIYQFEI